MSQDIKDDNFRIHKDKVKLLDFGLLEPYREEEGNHIEKKKVGFNGSPYYASIGALSEFSQSRKDDLESLGYTIMKLLNEDKIPWKDSTALKAILNSKSYFLKDDEIPYIYVGI